ncbi:MAG: hypothetical protein GY856_02885 [bacterium]|nr:hypothetical protein [bacterium]
MRGTKYGVLICGDVATHWGFDEFWGDVVLMREVLLKNGFSPENIFVLYGDGVDFSHPDRTNPRYIPSQPITNFAATIPNVELVFNGLASGDETNGLPQMTEDDFLFVWTFDHGSGGGGHAYLCLRDGNMLDSDFAVLLDNIAYGYRVIAMQQCFSGGFVNDLANARTAILTACAPDELASRADDSPSTENEVYDGVTYHHGEFNFHLFSALVWEKIDYTNVGVDADLDRFASMSEVFDYVQANDSRPETPQYDDGPDNIGDWLNLERDVFVFMRDNPSDAGQVPAAGPWWSSPDLWVRNNDDNGTAHQNPVAGSTNYTYARLHNRGIVRSGPVTVKFFSAGFAGTEFVYPTDYSDLITWASVDGIPAGATAVVKGPWIASELAAAPAHPCLLAEVYEHSGIPSSGVQVWESNHLVQKNLTIVYAKAGQTILLPILVGCKLVNQVRPYAELRILKGGADLEAWLEIRDRGWRELTESRAATESRRRLSLVVEGSARLRMGFPSAEEGDGPRSVSLDLSDGSAIYLDPEEGTLEPRSEVGTGEEVSDWSSGRVMLDLENPRLITLPPLIRTRQTLMLGAKVPERAEPESVYQVDFVRKDHGAKVVGGVRVAIQVQR